MLRMYIININCNCIKSNWVYKRRMGIIKREFFLILVIIVC